MELMPEQHRDGVSMMPLLKSKKNLNREAIFWHFPHYGNQGGTPGSSVRVRDHKLIEFLEDGSIELYNLRKDISEKHNIVKEEPEITSHLKLLLKEWRERVEAKIPKPNPDYANP